MSNKNNNGKNLEYLIQLIEKSINPESIVQHDIMLPDLTSNSGKKRQCDIVIKSGKPPRETISIVEVQDRKSKVDISTFDGWISKMESVGAQHLICVSRHDYPDSIKERASQKGNAIRLIVLKELTAENIPLEIFSFKAKMNFFIVTKFNNVIIKNLERSKPHKVHLLNVKKKMFSFDKKKLYTISDICKENTGINDRMKGTSSLVLPNKNHKTLWQIIENKFYRIELSLNYTWENVIKEAPTALLTYEQDNYGSIAWVYEARYNINNEFLTIKLPVVKNGDLYQVRHIYLDHYIRQ